MNYQSTSSICYRDKIDLKILKSDWLKAFLSISQALRTSQIRDLSRNTANNTKFDYKTNCFQKLQKKQFLAHSFANFPHFGKFLFSKNSGSVARNYIWVSNTIPKSTKKTMIQFQENALTNRLI